MRAPASDAILSGRGLPGQRAAQARIIAGFPAGQWPRLVRSRWGRLTQPPESNRRPPPGVRAASDDFGLDIELRSLLLASTQGDSRLLLRGQLFELAFHLRRRPQVAVEDLPLAVDQEHRR